MKFNIVKVFCEILSGLVLIILIIPILELSSSSNLEDIWTFIIENMNASNVTLLIVFSYLLGLIVDSIGFSIGELFLDKCIYNEKNTDDERKAFYKNVSAHVLSYRDTQWAYASLYRNLFILFIPHAILWSICLWINFGTVNALIVFISAIILEILLFMTIRGLYKFYIDITKSLKE